MVAARLGLVVVLCFLTAVTFADDSVRVEINVIDPDGEPIPDVEVSHRTNAEWMRGEDKVAAVRTDHEGRASISIEIRSRREDEDEFWHGYRLGRIVLTKRGYLEREVFVRPDWGGEPSKDAGPLVLFPAASLELIVLDEAEEPVADATVTIIPRDRGFDYLTSEDVTTDKGGRAKFPEVRAGRYQVRVNGALFADVLELEVGKPTTHRVFITDAVSIPEITVVYPDGKVCRHCYVWIWTDEGWNERFEIRDGRIPLGIVPTTGPYKFEIDHGGMKEVVLEFQTRDEFPPRITVERGVDLVVRAVNGEGATIPPDDVYDYPLGLSIEADGEHRTLYSEFPRDDGALFLTDLPRESFRLTFHAMKGYQRPEDQVLDGSIARRLEVVYELKPWQPLGIVVKGMDGSVIPDARLLLEDPSGRVQYMFESVTDENGRGETRWTGDPKAKLVVVAEGLARAEFDISGFKTGTHEVVLERGTTLSVSFLGPNGKKVMQQMGVDIVSVEEGGIRIGSLCRDGRPLVLENVPKGSYHFEVTVIDDDFTMSAVMKLDQVLVVDQAGVMEKTVKLSRIPKPSY